MEHYIHLHENVDNLLERANSKFEENLTNTIIPKTITDYRKKLKGIIT